MAIDKSGQGWFLKEVFLTKLPSDMRLLFQMQRPSSPVVELTRTADLWRLEVKARLHETPPKQREARDRTTQVSTDDRGSTTNTIFNADSHTIFSV